MDLDTQRSSRDIHNQLLLVTVFIQGQLNPLLISSKLADKVTRDLIKRLYYKVEDTAPGVLFPRSLHQGQPRSIKVNLHCF